MKDPEQLIKLINSYPSDIKAEVVIADLLQFGILPSDLLFLFESSFKRGYSKDILKAEIFPLNRFHDTLAISMARNGLYDLLPEGLFHTSPDAALSPGNGMATDSKREYKIEKETRKFFLPFENEIFYHRVLLELQERSILQRLHDNSLEDFFLDFWKIDTRFPKNLIIKLSAMLPFTKEITGDFEMTASCLGAILQENVTYSIHYKSDIYDRTDSQYKVDEYSLGKTSLGTNMIIGNHLPENCKMIRFSIGPLQNTEIDPYLENGSIARFINCFGNYFIPVEMDVSFDVMMPTVLQGFVLGKDTNQSILDYSTII